MIRRIASFILLFIVIPAMSYAILEGTAHDFEFGNIEPDPLGCGSACHSYLDPESGATLEDVKTAWFETLQDAALVGSVAAMCGSCHLSGSSYGAVMEGAASDLFAYGENSHGSRMSLGDMPPGTEPMGSGLPYVGTESGVFQCSTCHNPHDDSTRPFLRDQMDSLCARCHTQRNFVGGIEKSGTLADSGAWGMKTAGGAANPGSHPVGEDIVENRPGGPVVTIGALFRTPFSPDAKAWSLGPHLSNGVDGGVTCATCHAVHGKQPDEHDTSFSGVSEEPKPAFLSVEQSVGDISGYSHSLANGAGDSNPLCEACHGVENNPIISPGGAAWSDSDYNVNPGGPGTFSHPVDSYPSSLDASVATFPGGWPAGSASLSGAYVSPVPICESCHAPHTAAAISAGRADVSAGGGPYILRAPLSMTSAGELLCNGCHGNSIENHHPTGKQYNSTGVVYLQNVTGGSSDLLSCTTCHVSAHNWVEPGWPGLDPSWLPFNNARSDNQADDMFDPDMSKTCMDCHYSMDGDGDSVSPTMGSFQTVIGPSDDEYNDYQAEDRSMGTHYIGLIHEEGKWRSDPIINIYDTNRTWREQSSEYSDGLADGWSRFGGSNMNGSRVIVCESCHELEPDKNGGFRHLLLAPYEEGRNGMDEYPGDVDGRDVLCEACHGVPEGTHPLTGMIVSRTQEPLNCFSDWIRPSAEGYATLGRSTDAMSCDSCHQPHDANSNSYTFMLDSPDKLTLQETGESETVVMGNIDNPNPAATSYYPDGDYATPTLESVGGDHSGFCRQCHQGR